MLVRKATQLTAGITKLGAHKGLLIVPTADSPGLTAWAYNTTGATFSLGMVFANKANAGPQIFPMSVYAVTDIANANVYGLN